MSSACLYHGQTHSACCCCHFISLRVVCFRLKSNTRLTAGTHTHIRHYSTLRWDEQCSYCYTACLWMKNGIVCACHTISLINYEHEQRSRKQGTHLADKFAHKMLGNLICRNLKLFPEALLYLLKSNSFLSSRWTGNSLISYGQWNVQSNVSVELEWHITFTLEHTNAHHLSYTERLSLPPDEHLHDIEFLGANFNSLESLGMW